MPNELVLTSYYLMWNLLVFTSICFLISGLDDLFFDIYYWISSLIRAIYLRHASKLSYAKLINKPEKRIAIMVACWHEAGIIETMLKYNVYTIDYENYDIFVGVYSNDPETVKSVRESAEKLPHVQCVIGPDPGPTNKARNLNAIYNYILEHEKSHHVHYDIFVLNDSEDIIHELSLKLYNYLMPKNSMVQIPIFPLDVPLTSLIHWTYAAEFSEIHTKDIHVRERIGGLVPSAGVGTAFSREALDILKESRNGIPFATNTLTEDYNTSLQIRLHKLRQIFAMQYVYRTRWKKKWYFFGPLVPTIVKEYIATRAMFPNEYTKSVRQKARWIYGIAFEEWINTGWPGNIATLYTLLHDRKSIFTHLVTGLFFILLPFWFIYDLYTRNLPYYPSLQDGFDQYPWVWHMIIFSSILMINRALQRAISTYRVYGIWPAITSIPLILYVNVINLHALLRAYSTFLFVPKKTGQAKWDKTDHTFPASSLLLPYKLKLGEVLMGHHLITQDQLNLALTIQGKIGDQLGDVLVRLGFVSNKQISTALAHQYDLELISPEQAQMLTEESLPLITAKAYKLLNKYHCLPIKISGKHVTVAIKDPSNELALEKSISLLKPYSVKFVLIERQDSQA